VLAGDAIPEAAFADNSDAAPALAPPRAETSPATALTAWPTGKNLPEPGAILPPELPPAAAGAAVANATPSPAAPPVPLPLPALIAQPRAGVVADGTLPEAAAPTEHVPPPAPGQHTPVRSPATGTPARLAATRGALPDAASAPQDEALLVARSGEAAEPAELPPVTPDFASIPQGLAVMLPFVPVPPGDVVTAAPAALLSPASGEVAATATATATAAASAVPMRAALPAALASPHAPSRRAAPADVSPAPVPALAPEPSLASASDTGALPDAEVSAAPSPAPSHPVTTPVPTPPQLAERPADPRGAAPTAPAAPQRESAIAQVGDIREALRNARPAMTLQHAEFGAVSLRLEPAAPDQWRAVLASRDPGFVPAIHAALADRAVAAAAETSASFSGHSGASQNGAGDQRYGSSPNQGQGSPQPYLGQSGTRDGEAAPDHRRPSTAAALAARGGSEAEDPAALAPGTGGLFA
jgi:hypothetical protein